MNLDLPDRIYFGNSVQDYVLFAAIILAGIVFKRLISKIFSLLAYRFVKRYAADVQPDIFHELLRKPFAFFVLLVVAYLACHQLNFPDDWKIGPEEHFGIRMVLWKLYLLLVIFSITRIFMRLVDFFGIVLSHRAALTASRLDDQLVPFFKDTIKILIVVLSFFFTLAAVFKVNVVTLIGGLGIGGLAVALAAKESLENLFGSFTIFLDRPFIVGDVVKVGSIHGQVETIGLRSTRIRTLDKTLITVPNKKMVDVEVENVTERNLWRARYPFGILYKTPAESIKKIISQVQQFLDGHEQIAEGSVVNLDNFNNSSIDILVLYLVKTSVFEEFQIVKEQVNFRIMEIVRANHSDFAFPTTSVYLEKTDS